MNLIDPNGEYFIGGSTLPVFIVDDGPPWLMRCGGCKQARACWVGTFFCTECRQLTMQQQFCLCRQCMTESALTTRARQLVSCSVCIESPDLPSNREQPPD
jgi:hypothetical protein